VAALVGLLAGPLVMAVLVGGIEGSVLLLNNNERAFHDLNWGVWRGWILLFGPLGAASALTGWWVARRRGGV
jgi:hypothetical protein